MESWLNQQVLCQLSLNPKSKHTLHIRWGKCLDIIKIMPNFTFKSWHNPKHRQILKYPNMIQKLLLTTAIIISGALAQAQAQPKAQPQLKLSGPVDTTYFKHADFKWHITPRHDYSKTLVGKLFLSQAHFDEIFKLRDNGKQTNYMNCAEALEAIKAMDKITLGMPKIMYLVGWQYNGHDSKYPAFFECNEAIKAPGDANAYESILKLIEEAKKYNTAVSFHINMFNCYDDSPLFKKYLMDDVLAKYEDGSYVFSDWGYSISYARDWATGNAQARLDKLCELFPISEAGTLHIDAFHSYVPVPKIVNDKFVYTKKTPISPYHHLSKQDEIDAQLNIIKYLDSKGIDVTSEYCPDKAFMGYMPGVWHKNDAYLYFNYTPKQIGCTNTNFFGDVFCRNVNAETAFKDGGNTMHDKAMTFKKNFCISSLPYFYISGLTPIVYYKSRECDDACAKFTEGVTTYYVNDKFYLYKDGVLLANDTDIFIPAKWTGDNIVVAYSDKGYKNVTWTIPSDVKVTKDKAKAYRIDDDGEHYTGEVQIRNGKVTLSLAADEMMKIEF